MTQILQDKLFEANGISAEVLRLDLIHPDVSGNKWFKLKYHLREAELQGKKGIVSFGGPYSNHLAAMSYLCWLKQWKAVAIIRGERPETPGPTLQQITNQGTECLFVSRTDYRSKEELIEKFLSAHPDYYYIPEGGQSALGVKGAAEICGLATSSDYTHIFCAVGTGTTIAGIINSSRDTQQVIGISILKIADRNNNELLHFLSSCTSRSNYHLLYDYHFGGYAKRTRDLTDFMNALYGKEQIPTDFIYTGKLFYALFDLVKKKFFPSGSKILIIHSGGLQGNRSLPEGLLHF